MTKDILSAFRPALVLTGLFAVLLGIVYPMALTGIAQVVFPAAANGSLIERDGSVVGSRLIGQAFSRPDYFHPRPSAAGKGYDATASAGSNLGPTSKALADRVKDEVSSLQTSAGDPVPPDLVTTSASGLDPHISPEAAYFQVSRVAAARGVSETAVRTLVAEHAAGPALGFLGDPRVNVFDSMSPARANRNR